MEVYVIRHPPVHNPNHVCYGQSDIDLIEPFDDYTNFILKEIPENIEITFSSPSKRCTTLAHQLPFQVITDEKLLEINFGNWEQKKWSDIPISDIDTWNHDIVFSKPYHGENLYELNQRVEKFLKELVHHKYDKVLIVTHAGVIRCLWSSILEIPLQNIMKLPISFNEILHFNLDENKSLTYIKRKA